MEIAGTTEDPACGCATRTLTGVGEDQGCSCGPAEAPPRRPSRPRLGPGWDCEDGTCVLPWQDEQGLVDIETRVNGESVRTAGRVRAKIEMIPGVVNIYLSAGPVSGDPLAAEYRSCDLDNVANCDIYRLGWDFSTMTAVDAERIDPHAVGAFGASCPGGLGHVQPAISPDGTHLAWTAACFQNKNVSSVMPARIAIQRLGGFTTTFSGPMNDHRGFPEWLDDNTILFDVADSVWQVDKTGTSSVAVAGPDAGQTTIFKNPRVHRSPAYRTYSGGGARMATFGKYDGQYARPRVSKTDGTSVEEFGVLATSHFTDCHHPAWNPDGTEIVCQREWDVVPRVGFDEKPLYRFIVPGAGTTWVSDGELFASPSSASLESAMGVHPISRAPLFPMQSAPFPSCKTRAWRSAQWCHSDDFVVVTLTCTDTSVLPVFAYGTFTSRVVLVDLRDSSPRLYDITRELEHLLGVTPGSYRSIFATCGTPS